MNNETSVERLQDFKAFNLSTLNSEAHNLSTPAT